MEIGIIKGEIRMANQFQGKGCYQWLYNTELNAEQLLTTFHPENIIDMKMTITLADGSVHKVQICDILDVQITDFMVDGEEVFSSDIEDKEKITRINPVIKLAI
jgi:hypothetical protein